MDSKPLARASIPYLLTAGITLSIAGLAGNAFSVQNVVADAATNIRRGIARAVLSDDPAEFVATVQPAMRTFSGTASATGAQEALASLVEETERYQSPEKRDAAFRVKLDAYVSSLPHRQGAQDVSDFVRYVFDRIGADNARTEVIRALAGLPAPDRQRAVEVMYGTLDEAQKTEAAKKLGLEQPGPELQKLLDFRATAPAKSVDTLIRTATNGISLLDAYCEKGVMGLLEQEQRDRLINIGNDYCHSR